MVSTVDTLPIVYATISDLNQIADDYCPQQDYQIREKLEKRGKEAHDDLGLPKRATINTYVLEGRDLQRHYNYTTNSYDYTKMRPGLKRCLLSFLQVDEWGGRDFDDDDSENKIRLRPIKAEVLGLDVVNIGKKKDSYYYNHTVCRGDVLVTLVGKSGNAHSIVMSFKNAEQLLSIKLNDNLSFTCRDKTYTFPDPMVPWEGRSYYDNDKPSKASFVYDAVNRVYQYFGSADNISTYLKSSIKDTKGFTAIKTDGIGKLYAKIAPIAEGCAEEDPASFIAFRTLAANTKRTIEKVKVSTLFNQTFGEVTDKAGYLAAIKPVRDALADNKNNYTSVDEAIKSLPMYYDKRKAALKSSATGAFNRMMKDFDFIKDTLDENKFPKIYAAIHDGEIPISTFFRKNEQYFLLNDNWELWEKMLTKHRETTIELAKEVSKRSTYEKDLMSYFYFVLYELPEYLKKHTGVKWDCSPKLVDSPSELEPPEEGDNGVTKKRSALTPIVDNEKHTVEVPYASLAMPGRQTTYCYSHTYSIIKRGFALNGNTALSELEEKLNGRDDYGLMFYTLTGSAQGRGYPTFLIIFERRTSGTHVHFHRTHPCRSKDGDYNPVHNWIRTSYNWMAGNVHKSRITAQQGDLVFVKADENYKNTVDILDNLVDSYDNHRFAEAVKFTPNKAKVKSNLLGHFLIEKDTVLNHPEHNAITVPAGFYELRQCRSWEANPAGVWSLRID